MATLWPLLPVAPLQMYVGALLPTCKACPPFVQFAPGNSWVTVTATGTPLLPLHT